MGKTLIKNPFAKFDKLMEELKEDILDAKPKFSESDKKEIADELKKASDIAARILDSVKK